MHTPRPDIGDRVVVRRRNGNHLSDIIGHVLSLQPLVVRPQKVGGLPSSAPAITIPEEDIQVVRRLSPRRIRNSDIRTLERIAATAFPGTRHEWSINGQWLLRAGHGITERSNSAAPLGPSALYDPLPVAEILRFYNDAQLTPQILVPDRIGPRLPQDRWELGPDILVMTRAVPEAGAVPDADAVPEPIAADTPSEEWLSLYAFRGTPLPADDGILDGHCTYLHLGDPPRAIARLHLNEGYAGISGVAVHPEYRGRGLGRALGQAILRWAAQQDAHTLYLHVQERNAAGRALYSSLGFIEHHRHRYARWR